mgnify:CR=1 FL=1
MIANLYIIPQSFNHDAFSSEFFFLSLHNLIADYHNLVKYKDENKIYIQEDVFYIDLPNGINLAEFVYSNDLKLTGKEKSLKQTLSNILMKLPQVSTNIDEIKLEISKNSIDSSTGIISLFPIDNIALDNQIVYDVNSWFHFRRHHLGLFFGDSNYFINECVKYFPNIFFHDNNYSSVDKILKDFALKIIKHLVALHDVLPMIMKNETFSNHADLLVHFSSKAGLDEIATLEGGSKTRLKFKFKNIKGKIEELICEPHLKLCTNDKGDSKYFQNRIYFHFGKDKVEESKILVAHIGEHL